MTIEELKKGDVIVNSVEEMPLNQLICAFVGVYDHPFDYPDKIVARVFILNHPTHIVMLKDTVEEIDAEMAKTGFYKFLPGKEDDPKLICCWG